MAPTDMNDADAYDRAARDRILDAATKCFLHLGIAKTTMHDVARLAELSRGTVYRYFPDRRSLIDATVKRRAQRYYDEAADAMAAQPTLASQIGALAEVFARTFGGGRYGTDIVSDDLDLFRIIASDIDGALGRMSSFLRPYVREAKVRREVRADVDEVEGSELLARMLMSLTAMPTSAAFDLREPITVRRYLERYAVAGLGA